MPRLRRLALVSIVAIATVLPVTAAPASAAPPPISCDPSGLSVICKVEEDIRGVGKAQIVCEISAADLSELPTRVEFASGGCNVKLTADLLDTTIHVSCSGSSGFLDTDPAIVLQIGEGTCSGTVKVLGLPAGAIETDGRLSTITIAGTAVTYEIAGAQFVVSVPGIGVGLDCTIEGTVVLNPNAPTPILIHPPLPAC